VIVEFVGRFKSVLFEDEEHGTGGCRGRESVLFGDEEHGTGGCLE
jgi:hypothetical protein